MAKSKTDHVIFRNGNLFCSHCGAEQKIPFPMEIPVFTAMSGAFAKSHANCLKTWAQPVPDQNLSVKQKAEFWWNHGEHGRSSEFMFDILSGKKPPYAGNYPLDPSDFKRCHGLLEMVPEWRGELDKLRPCGRVWNNLVDNWDKLTEMLLEQMSTKKPNGMYELMKTLGC